MANDWRAINPFNSLWDNEEYQQILNAISSGEMTPEEGLDIVENLQNSETEKPKPEQIDPYGKLGSIIPKEDGKISVSTKSREEMFNPFLQGQAAESSELDWALDILGGISSEVKGVINVGKENLNQKATFKQYLEDLDKTYSELTSNELGYLNSENRLPEEDRQKVVSEMKLDNIFNAKKEQELLATVNELSGNVPSTTYDSDGNLLIAPTDKPMTSADIGEHTGVGVNYTKQDLIEHYKGAPQLRGKSDPEIYAYVKKYRPDQVAPFEWEEEHGWGSGYAKRTVENAWLDSQERLKFTSPIATNILAADLSYIRGKAGHKGGLDNPANMTALHRLLKEENPSWDNVQIHTEGERIKNTDMKELYAETVQLVKDMKTWRTKQYENNPELVAQLEWDFKNIGSEWSLRDDGFDNMGKHLFKLGTSAMTSVVEAWLKGKKYEVIGRLGSFLVGFTGAGIAKKGLSGALNWGMKAQAVTGRPAQMVGQFAYGYQMEGGQHMLEAIQHLTNFRELTPEEFKTHIETKVKHFEEIAENPQAARLLLENYQKNELLKKDNRFYIKPMEIEEAISAASVGMHMNGLLGGFIEQIDQLFSVGKVMPKMYKGFTGATIFENVIKKADDLSRTIKATLPRGISVPLTKLPSWGAEFVARGIPEGLEEVAQEMTSIGIKAYGPAFQDKFKWAPELNFDELFSYKSSIRDPFLGGMLGAGSMSFVGITAEETGFAAYLDNKRTRKYFETNNAEGYFVKKMGKVYRIVKNQLVYNQKTDEFDSNPVELTPEMVKDRSSGESDSVEFDNLVEANNMARKFNEEHYERQGKIFTWMNKGLLDKDFRIEKITKALDEFGLDTKEVYIVRSYRDGKLIENIEEFDSYKAANRVLKKYNKKQQETEKAIEDYGGLEELEGDAVIVSLKERLNIHEKDLDDKTKDIKTENNLDETDIVTTESTSDPDVVDVEINSPKSGQKQQYTESQYKTALKSFIVGSKYGIDGGVEYNNDAEIEEGKEYERLTFENPSIIRDAILYKDGALLDDIAPNGIAKEEFIKDVDDYYGDPTLTTELRDILFKDIEVKDDVQETPTTETKDVEAAPEVAPEVEVTPTVEKDIEVRDDVKVRPEQKVTPQTIKDYTDKELDAKIEQAKRESKSKTKSKKKRAKLALKVAEKEKARREVDKKKEEKPKHATKEEKKARIKEIDKELIEVRKAIEDTKDDPDAAATFNFEKIERDFLNEKEELREQLRELEEKKGPEVEEDIVTIPGHIDTEGKPETMPRAKAEKRLDQLLNPTYLPGEEGAEDAMIAGDEIRALQEGLAEKKHKLTIQKEGSKNEKRTKNVLEYLFDKFAGKIEYETINDPTLYKNGKPVEAYYDTEKKKVIINTAFATTSSPFHEFAHPFITVLRTENKTLFNNLVKEILATPEGVELLHEIIKSYKHLTPSKNDLELTGDAIKDINAISDLLDFSKLKALLKIKTGSIIYKKLQGMPEAVEILEELLAFSIEKSADKQYKPQSTFKRVVNKILNFFRNMFFGKSNTVYAQALESDTTIEDIGRLFANSDVTIRFKNRDKSLTDTNYDFSKNPRNMHQFKLKIEKEGKEIVKSNTGFDLDDVIPGSRRLDAINQFFQESFDNMLSIAATNDMSIDIQDFVRIIADKFPKLKTALEQWVYNNYGGKRIIGGSNNSLVPPDDGPINLKGMFKDVYAGVDEGLDLRNALELGFVYEKNLTVNDVMFLRELDINISISQLHRIYEAARESEYKNFEDWRQHILSNILNFYGDITPKENRELLKLYNRLYSSVPVNQNITSVKKAYLDAGHVVPNFRTNYIIRRSWIGYEELPGGQQGRWIGKWKYEIEIKGPKNDDNRNNPQYDKRYAFEFDPENETVDLIHWISGNDVRKSRIVRRKDGGVIMKNGKPVIASDSWYDFLTEEHLLDLEEILRKDFGRTIAFSRGDEQSIATVKITEKHKENSSKGAAKKYWERELKNGYLKNISQILELLQGSDMDRASNIAVHEAMKKVYPKYAGDKAANVYKRMKIPFSKVTVSKSMPNFILHKFNPDEVMFKFTDPETGEVNIFDPIVEMDTLGDVYIGDGNSITSQALFDLFVEHFGLSPGQAKAKTVIYEKDGDDVVAVKHEHVLPKRGFEIVSRKNQDEVLYTVDNNRNIEDANGNPVHMLSTDDEIKIGDMFSSTKNSFEVSGQSVGFIKFDEKVKATIPHIMQWYNHVDDPEILRQFLNTYIPKLDAGIRKAFNKALDRKDIKTQELITAEKQISKILDKLEGTNEEGFIPIIVELARLGGGLHPSLSIRIDHILQTQILNPLLKLSTSSGSIFDISVDMTGQLGENEVSLSIDNALASGIVFEQYREKRNLTKKQAMKVFRNYPERVNKWLQENEVYVWVSRSPVPHVGGAYMARVKSLHGRKSMADLNPLDVKVKLEGDGDGDKVHIEALDPETMRIYKDFIEGKQPNALNLEHFVKQVSTTIMTSVGRIKLISQLTFGKNSIAEIANVGLAYGSINKIFEAFKIPGNIIQVRKPNENVDTDLYYALSDNKKWSGTVEEMLRLYLQGAVDNGKYNLLSNWKYSQEKLAMKLFKYPDGRDISIKDYRMYIKPILKLHIEPAYIRKGRPPGGIKYNTKQIIHKSQQYLEYTQNRVQFLIDGRHLIFNNGQYPVTGVSLIQGGISPIEQIAIAPANNFNNWKIAHKAIGLNGTPFMLSDEVYQNAHYQAMVDLEASRESVFKHFLENLDGGKVNPKVEHRKGMDYYNDMMKEYKRILVLYVEEGLDSLERNPILLQWQEEYGNKFKELSNYARAIATYEFLREYNNLKNNISVRRSQSVAPSFPPSSAISTRVSLLDHRVIRAYFDKFNNHAKNNRSTKKLESLDPAYASLLAMASKQCK